MNSLYRKESLVLLLGDFFFFLVSLWLALLIRNLEVPSSELFSIHAVPFSLLFIAWILVFYIAGLYEKHTVILKSKLPNILANTQFVNSGLAVVFFYFIPFFGITPKTILFIYLFISFIIILAWRMYGYFVIGRGHPNNAVLIGSGDEMKELLEEVNNNPIYNIKFVSSIDLNRADEQGFWNEIVSHIYSEDVSIIAIDLANKNIEPVLPHLYNMIFSKISFIDMHKIYEDIFDRVPLSLLKYNWFLENISTSPRAGYDALKRIMDFSIALVLFVVSLVLYPFIMLAIKLDDGGKIFSFQKRVGENNKLINIMKFRTMTIANDEGKWDEQKNEVTKVGKFLRRTRLDELPQLWNVLMGDISLIGPRPEFPDAVKHYSEELSYYNVRHLIKPGLSGWAQIYHDAHPHHSVDTLETKNKLSYDLYYIKNRSFLLDLKIALRTLKTLASIAGR
ncbi:MAG: exopolysaccharide biosynthesis polyprenyl glycosylphosphotransferase [bacterium]|nr:exopolysaccharide biosynthesis polyprenyl glycosylphosphotransferase [bacterium]